MSAITLALAKSELQQQSDSEDAYIQALIDGVEDWLESEWGVLLSLQSVSEDLFGGERALWPSKVPVASVTTVSLNGSTVASGNYTLRGNAIVHDDEWDADFYDVVYQAGFAAVPARVQSLILSLLRRRYDARGGPDSESAGGHDVSWQKLMDTDEVILLKDLAGGPPC